MSSAKTKPTKDRDKAKLTLSSLTKLSDGEAEVIINAALSAAIRDVEDRGDDGKPRKVVIEVIFEKLDGSSTVTANVAAKFTAPPYKTKPTVGNLELDGNQWAMSFNPNNAKNPDQKTIPLDEFEDADDEATE